MSKGKIKEINKFFSTCTKEEYEKIESSMLLTDEQVEAMKLFYWKKKSYVQIATELNCSVDQIAKWMTAIRNKAYPLLPDRE